MMEIVKYKGKLEIIRNIIRDTMLGNLALAVLIFGIFSLRANNQGVIEELFSYVLMFGSVIVFVWLIMMVYIYFNELIKNVIIRWYGTGCSSPGLWLQGITTEATSGYRVRLSFRVIFPAICLLAVSS